MPNLTNIRPVPFDQQRQLCEFYMWNVLDPRTPALRTPAYGHRLVVVGKSHMTVVEKNCLWCGNLFARWYRSRGVANGARQALKYCDGCA